MDKRLVVMLGATITIMLAGPVFGWHIANDCEGETLGGRPADREGVFWGAETTLSNEQVSTGAQSCKFEIAAGSEGWPSEGGPLEWGAIFSFLEDVNVGQEVWLRFDLFIPAGFDIWTNTGMLKFIRLGTRIDTRSTGAMDILMGVPSASLWSADLERDVKPPFVASFEGAPKLKMVGSRPRNDVKTGVWETYEVYAKIGVSGEADGGQSIVRVWKNNTLIANLANQITAVDETGRMTGLYLFTYWNGRARSDQHAYMDNLFITNEKPANMDENGNAFIGGETYVKESQNSQISVITAAKITQVVK